MSASGLRPNTRRAHADDAPALLQIDRAASLSSWSEAEYRRICALDDAAGEGVIVIEVAGEVAGFGVFAGVLDEASIHNVVVAPNWQRQGLGRQLVEAIFRALPQARHWLLEVRASNAGARALYYSLGFVEDGRRPGYYAAAADAAAAGREDAVLMSLCPGEIRDERA